jgi:N-acetyl-gamma-glutamyl-phosphate reductase
MSEVLIFGASGYSGLELLRLLARHPRARVIAASSDREAGHSISDRVPEMTGRFTSHLDTLALANASHLAFLATPNETSAELAPKLLAKGLRVIDLSGAFRLADPNAYPEWYGFSHPHPELLREAHYGLPELMPMPENVRLIANPGCYATAAALAVAPLLDLFEGPVILDGKSGTTGAGRKAEEALLFAEVAENLRAYRVGKHQHTPEIEQVLSRIARREMRASFTAHLIPMRRGILMTAYLRAKAGVAQVDVDAAIEKLTADRPFLRRVPRPPETQRTLYTNVTELGASLDPRTRTIVSFAALDNLVKGAAGQAIQNLNLMLGLPAEAGLV